MGLSPPTVSRGHIKRLGEKGIFQEPQLVIKRSILDSSTKISLDNSKQAVSDPKEAVSV